MIGFMTEQGDRLRAEARDKLAEARRGPHAEAELNAREGLALYAKAMNYLEDTPHFESVHEEMHSSGRWVREAFGCSLHQEGEHYEQRCPVAVVHKRLGFSPEIMVREWHCSICNRPPEECDHIGGREYDGERCYRVITRADFVSVSIVNRPAQPEARLLALPLSVEELRRALPPEWSPGMPVNCDQCLLPCPGVEEVPIGLHGAPPDDAGSQ
jgi:hypothetical protein